MDSFTLLRQKQRDFCHRLEVGKSFLDGEHYLSTELVILEQNTIEEVTLLSIQETEDIIHEYKFHYPHQQILNHIFYGKLVEYGFCSRYDNSFSLIQSNPKNINFDSYNVTQHHFYLINNQSTRILLKSYHGDLDNGILTLSNQEFNEHDVFIFSLSPQSLAPENHKFPILLLGFITKDLIKETVYYNNNLKFNLEIRDLLYIDGLVDYFTISSENIKIKKELSEVDIFFKKGEYHQVIKFFEKDTQDNFTPDKLAFIKGICYYRLGQNRKAIDSFLQVIKLKGNSSLSYHWLGQIYQDLDEYGRALSCYNTEIKLSGLNFFAYFNRAFVHSKLDNFVQALDDYNVAIKINQNFFQTFYNRGIVCHKLGDHYSAIDNYLQALTMNPELASAHYNLAIIYQELSDYKKAIASYQQAIKIKKNYINAYYNLAILQANVGLYKQSIETYEKIFTINPSFLPAIYNHKSLVLLLKKEGHIALIDKNVSSNVVSVIPDVISISAEDKMTYSSQDKSENNLSDNNVFNFFPVD